VHGHVGEAEYSVYNKHFTSSSEPGSRLGLIALFSSGATDMIEGALQWRLWYLIGSGEMRRRYARSRLGQLWIILTSAIAVSTIGLVWSYLWAQPVATKLKCHCLCKVEMSLGGIAGSVSRRRGDHHIGAAPALAGSFRVRFGDFGHSQGTVLQEAGRLA
jgi:hypothetical protein